MRCAGCMKDLEDGDLIIRDTVSAFVGRDSPAGLDAIVADVMGGEGPEVAFCESCTQKGGRWIPEPFKEVEE
jgi:hypothetical protein